MTIEQGIQPVSKTLHGITGAWVADQEVMVDQGKVTGSRVRMRVTIVLEH